MSNCDFIGRATEVFEQINGFIDWAIGIMLNNDGFIDPGNRDTGQPGRANGFGVCTCNIVLVYEELLQPKLFREQQIMSTFWGGL